MSRAPLAAVPTGPVDVPGVVRELAGDDVVTPVWRNELGGLTFRLDPADGAGTTRFVKWVAAGTPEIDLAGEAARLAWVADRSPVPHVLAQGSDDDGAWLVTRAMPGRSAVDSRWVAAPATAALAIGRGLRLLHDALPVDDCPFGWGADERPGGAEARARWGAVPAVDRLVVCHGDACVPNTLLHDDGTFAAHVDLGSPGVADRWADLAVAAWSTEWNYGPGYDGHVYAGYGVEPDAERIAFYRLLWDLG